MTTVASRPQVLLLVEDNPGDADRIQDLLSSAAAGRYRIFHVLDLKEARSSLAERDVDVVLLDLGLPDGNGTDTVRHVRESAENVPIVVLTGSNDDDLAISCISAGAQDYLVKGDIEPASLAKAIKYAVTRRLEAEARKIQLQNLLSALPDAVVVCDLDGTARYANNAAIDLFQLPRDVFIGMPVPFPTGDEWLPEFRFDRSGSLRLLEIQITSFEWEAEPAFLACLRDNTDYRALTEQLRDAQKLEAIGRLAGGVAHDFNNLLTIINGYSESLLDEPAFEGENREAISEILEAGRRAAALTRQLLAFGRRSNIAPRVVNLSDILTDMQNMLRRFIGEDIEIEVNLAAGACNVYGDRHQLEQVFMNLAINARDAMPAGGKLIITTDHVAVDRHFCTTHANEIEPGDYIVVIFSDTGIGIGAEDMKHIFEPFFTTKEMGHGTGLGLATAHGLIKQMGGYIGCYSEVDLGTTFKLYIPQANGATAHRDETQVPAINDLTGSETILLVEDEVGVRDIIQRTLERNGYTVLPASDGINALRVGREYTGDIDLLLTDVVMPHMSGATLARKLHEARPGLRVLYMSGYPYNVISGRGILAEGELLLQKPFAAAPLLTMVRKVLAPAT